MHPNAFDYHRPASLAEALELLGSVDGARPLAGGHSLLPMMKQRLASPAALIDLGRIPGLAGITASGDGFDIGAMTTHAAIAASSELASGCAVLAETAQLIGDPQVRNRGTIGGSVAHADPAADYPTVLLALGATVTVTGATGERTIAAGDFFVDIFTTALQPGELVTSVHVPAVGSGAGAAYVKHKHPASGYAVVGVAAYKNGGGTAMAVGGVTGVPVVVPGSNPDDIPGALTDPIGDVYASGEYRVHLATVLAKRALALAEERATG